MNVERIFCHGHCVRVHWKHHKIALRLLLSLAGFAMSSDAKASGIDADQVLLILVGPACLLGAFSAVFALWQKSMKKSHTLAMGFVVYEAYVLLRVFHAGWASHTSDFSEIGFAAGIVFCLSLIFGLLPFYGVHELILRAGKWFRQRIGKDDLNR